LLPWTLGCEDDMSESTEFKVTTLSFYAHICPHCGMGFNYYATLLGNQICPLCGKEIDNENSPVK
jgi:uncharacterized protein (DUF983 family)